MVEKISESRLHWTPVPAGAEQVWSGAAVSFVAELVTKFRPRVVALLAARAARQAALDAGGKLDFLRETAAVRAADWRVPRAPADLTDRRVEITGPAERKMIINALNSGANVFMADLEDSLSPTWENVVQGQVALRDAVRRTLAFTSETGKSYALGEKLATLLVRPRGWHLWEPHVQVDGEAAPGALVDFGMFLFHNARELIKRGSGPYFYLPKMESHLEARLWNDVFVHAQRQLGLPTGTIRATVLIETLPAAFEMDEILYELREHASGLNCGRWDYIFSFIKKLANDPSALLPDRGQVTMTQPFLRAYSKLLIQTCHRRGAFAMGGMAAQIPIKDDPEANARALDKVRADKQREANDGHDGTWVAHPGLVAVAREVFDAKLTGPNQLNVLREDVKVSAADLLAIPAGTRTDAGLRLNLRVGVQYVEAWLRGQGCVPLYSLMEDAATAEISRAQVWQWLKHGATTDDGARVDVARVRAALTEELLRVRTEIGAATYDAGRFADAASLFLSLLEAPTFAPFLTTAAYAALHPEAPFPETTMQTQTQSPTEKIIAQANEKSGGEASPVKSEHANRWEGVRRAYSNGDVAKLRGSFPVEHTIAKLGAERLWSLLNSRPYVQALGALTGNMAMQQVRAGLEAIYLSGWQVAADANLAGGMYPDQSLYPANSVPEVVRKINQTLLRADQIEHAEGKVSKHWLAPIMADAEAGFGGPLNAFELMKSMIDAGAAGVHFEDQLSSEKKCGHLGGKVLVPTAHFVRTLIAARLAADVSGVPTVLVARTDADSAKLLTSDIDERDRKFTTGDRTPEGFFGYKGGVEAAIMRGQAYAPYADLIWCETSTPDLHEAKQFAEGIRSKFPNKMMAYNCSPSFNWKKKLSDTDIARFQRELGAMGYKFQFVTLAGFHALNHSMFKLAGEYKERGMSAYSELQQAEFASEAQGYTATKHQREVGTGYFDQVATVISGGAASTLALKESTESKQF